MTPTEALLATLLMATFPFVAVFTTLAYTETVFLFSTVSTWYFCKKGRIGVSSLLAGLASVTRIYGFAIIIPVFLDIVRRRRYRELLYLAIPVACIGSWLLFCYISTGDAFASWTDERLQFSSFSGGGNAYYSSLIQTILFQLSRGVPPTYLDPAVLASVLLFAYLVARVWEVDRLLWTYAAILVTALILAVWSHISLIRFLSFIFPIWLTVKVKNPVVVAICIALFVPATLLLWMYTLTVFFQA